MGRWRPPTSPEPYCIIGKVSWGVAQAIRVPESRASLYTDRRHGWTILIRDSEMPPAPSPPSPMNMSLLSGPVRRVDNLDLEQP